MPFEALSAKASEIVPVGAIESRWLLRILLGVEQREGAFFPGELDRRGVGLVAHRLGDPRAQVARLVGVVAQSQHDERVAEPGEAESYAALGARLGLLLLQWPYGRVEHVVEHAHRWAHHFSECLEVEARPRAEGLAHERRQVDRAEAAAAVGRKRLLSAGVGRFDSFTVRKVVVCVRAVDEEHARLGVIVGGLHDLLPQLARLDPAVHPQAVGALARLALEVGRGWLLVHEFPVAVGLDRVHEGVGHRHADVEVLELPLVLGVDEVLDVGVVAAEDPHLRAAARAGGFHGLAALVENAHVGYRAARGALGAAHPGAVRPDRRKVVAHAAAPAHRLRRLHQGKVDAGLAVHRLGNRVAHRLHEAVDERRLQLRARRGVDAPAGDETVLERFVEHRLPARGVLFDRSQGASDAPAHGFHALLIALGVFL